MNENEEKKISPIDENKGEPLPSEITPADPESVHSRILKARRTIPKEQIHPEETAEKTDAEKDDALPGEDKAAEQLPQEEEPGDPFSRQENSGEEIKMSPAAAAFDWIKSVLFSFAVVIFVFTVLFRGSTVVGSSMMNTLKSGERVIISGFLYTPKTGDIVVLQAPDYKNGEEFLIKRVIGTGGQTVRIDFQNWKVWVDGEELNEPYVLKDTRAMISESLEPDENGIVEFKVKENHVFVMGDNRNDSLDSRAEMIGQIDQQYIMGRVILRYLPFSAFGPVA